MRKFLFCLLSFLILAAFPLKALELDKDMIDDMSRSLSRALPPTIVGPDDREEITGKAEGAEKAAVILDITDRDGLSWKCSGAMIGYKTVLTAAHCITDERGRYAQEVTVYAVGLPEQEKTEDTEEPQENTEPLDPKTAELVKKLREAWDEALPDGTKFPNAKAKAIWVPQEYKKAVSNNDIAEQDNYDYGTLFLESELGKDTGVLGLKVLSEKEFADINIVTIGRGKDKKDYSLWRSPGRIKKDDVMLSLNLILFDADVLEGNSGGPIMRKSNPTNIIALANGQLKNVDYVSEGCAPNFALPIRQEIVDHINKVKKGVEDGFKSHPLPKDK